ncbi:MAG: nucleotidyltransferase domain-containing protein [Saprospiraceae bacterium]|nr:nucleotidyltransferase domain-containing protein [Saprospiraceae bacterium]
MNTIITQNKEKIDDICKEHHVKALYTFGSVNTDKFSKDSDIDLIVSFDMNKVSIEDYVDLYFGMLFRLEELLSREVDLVTERSIKNPYFKEEITKNRILIYQSSVN